MFYDVEPTKRYLKVISRILFCTKLGIEIGDELKSTFVKHFLHKIKT